MDEAIRDTEVDDPIDYALTNGNFSAKLSTLENSDEPFTIDNNEPLTTALALEFTPQVVAAPPKYTASTPINIHYKRHQMSTIDVLKEDLHLSDSEDLDDDKISLSVSKKTGKPSVKSYPSITPSSSPVTFVPSSPKASSPKPSTPHTTPAVTTSSLALSPILTGSFSPAMPPVPPQQRSLRFQHYHTPLKKQLNMDRLISLHHNSFP
ncbi:unnamed protein product [Mytilus edulis]|uniref:Uncharacterized protein n=1 Tax=Mytilus edulis TaxID=6550 RepID=A0A8S3SB36_MYTED|nr:unnamed protein product [Mytilus edulis]